MRARASTWNVAAINNNPFEYYASARGRGEASSDDGGDVYESFLLAVERALSSDAGGASDATMARALGPDALDALQAKIAASGAAKDGEAAARARRAYEARCGERTCGEFLRDAEIGAKRLCSMPDRVTNTVNVFDDEGERRTVRRPTVINCYDETLEDEGEWFRAWMGYMFDAKVRATRGGEARAMVEMLVPIRRAKYPAVSEEEEALGIPLQIFYLAAFDAALARVATTAAGSFEAWQRIRAGLVDTLVRHKVPRTLDVVEHCLLGSSSSDVNLSACFLQEVGASFADALEARESVRDTYEIYRPEDLDVKRDQNSIVLVSKTFTRGERAIEKTREILESLGDGAAKFSNGDFCAFLVRGVLFCSFHGDTDGLQTKVITTATHAHCVANDAIDACVFGMDANTHVAHKDGKKQGVTDFIDFLAAETTFTSCWTIAEIDVERDAFTTFSARTFLQAQLNKAVPLAEIATSALTDRHPKDHVLIYTRTDANAASLNATTKPTLTRINAVDFTAHPKPPSVLPFDADATFPNARFPSDHACVVFNFDFSLA